MPEFYNNGKVKKTAHVHRLPVHPAPSYSTSQHHATQKMSPTLTMSARKESRGRLETPRGDIPIHSYLTKIAIPSPKPGDMHSCARISPMTRSPVKTVSFASDSRVGTKDPARASWEESLLSADPVNPWLAKFKKYSKNPEAVNLSLQCSTVTSVGLPMTPKTDQDHDKSVRDVGNLSNSKADKKKTESPEMKNRVLLRQSAPVVHHSQLSTSAATSGRSEMPSYIKNNVTLLNLNDTTTIEALIERERRNNETQRRRARSPGPTRSAASAAGCSDSGVELQSKTISQSERDECGVTVVDNACKPNSGEESTQRAFNPAAGERCHSEKPEKLSSKSIVSDEEARDSITEDNALSTVTQENQSKKSSSRRKSPLQHGAQKKGPNSDHVNVEQSNVAEKVDSETTIKVKSSTHGPSNEKKSHRRSCKKHSRKEDSSQEPDVDGKEKAGSKQHSDRKAHKDSGSEDDKDRHKRHSANRKTLKTVHDDEISNDLMKLVDSKDAHHDEKSKQRHKHSDHREKGTRHSKDEHGEQAKHTCSSNRNDRNTGHTVRKERPKSVGSSQSIKETSDTGVKETDNLVKQSSNVAVGTSSTSVSPSSKGRASSSKDNSSKDITLGSTSEPISESEMNRSAEAGVKPSRSFSQYPARVLEKNVKTLQHVSPSAGGDESRDGNALSLISNTFELPSQPEGMVVIPTDESQALISGATYNLTCLDPRVEAALKRGQKIRIAGPCSNSSVATEGTGTVSSSVNSRQNARTYGPKTSMGLTATAATALSGITSSGYAVKLGQSVASTHPEQKTMVMNVRIPAPPLALVGARRSQLPRSYHSRLQKTGTAPQIESAVSHAQTTQLHPKPLADADSLGDTSKSSSVPDKNQTHEVMQIHCLNTYNAGNDDPPKIVTSEYRDIDRNVMPISQPSSPVTRHQNLHDGSMSPTYQRLQYISKGEEVHTSGPDSSTTPYDQSKQLHVDAPLVPRRQGNPLMRQSCEADCNKQVKSENHHQRDGDSTSCHGVQNAMDLGTSAFVRNCSAAMPPARNVDDVLKMPVIFERQVAGILLTVFHDVIEKRIVFVRDRCEVVKDVPRETIEVRIEGTDQTFVFKFEPVASTSAHLVKGPTVGAGDPVAMDRVSEVDKFSMSSVQNEPDSLSNRFSTPMASNAFADASESTSSTYATTGESDRISGGQRPENKLVIPEEASRDEIVLKENAKSNRVSEHLVDDMAKSREDEHTKKKKKSKRKKILESKAVDVANSDSWQSIPGTEPLVVKLRKDVRTGEEIPGSEGKIADVSLYSVVKPGKDEKTEAVEIHRPRFEHRKVTMRHNGNFTEFVWDHDKENVVLTPVSKNPDRGTDTSGAKVYGDVTPQGRDSEDGDKEDFQDLLPWELKHLNELSPNASEQDQDDGLIYESIGCDDIGMEWSLESYDNDREILESRSDIDIFVSEPYCDLFVQGKNIFRVGREDKESPNRSVVIKEKPSPYSPDSDEASWQECRGEEVVPYEEISGDVVDDLLVEGQAIFPTRVTWNEDEDGEGGIPDECFEEDMIKGDTFLGSSRDWTKNLEPEVKGLAIEVPYDGFLPLSSESFGFSCDKSQDPSVYDDFYESDYRNDTENVDSGHGSLQVLGVGLNPKSGGCRQIENSFLEDVRQLSKVLNDIDMSSETDGDNHLMRSLNASFQGDFKQKIGQIMRLMKSVKPGQLDDPRFKLGADIIKHLTNILSAQRGLLKVANITSSSNSIPTESKVSSQCSTAFHSIAYGSIISNISYVVVTADQILNMLALMKTEGESAPCSENKTSSDTQVPHYSQVASAAALNEDMGIPAPPSLIQTQQGVGYQSLKLTPNSVFIDSIDNSVDNKRKRLVVSSDSSDSSISQSNIPKCLSVSMEMQRKTPSDGRVRHQKKRVCQVDVIPSRSADWRSELLEKGTMTSTPVRQAKPSRSGQHLDVLPSVQEETQFPKGNGSDMQYSQSASTQYPAVQRYQSETPTKLNCSNAIYTPRKVVGETSLCPSLPNTGSSGNKPRDPCVNKNRVVSEVQQKEVSLTKKTLRIESGTGAYGEWTFRLTPNSRPKQKNVGSLGWDSPTENVRNAVACGVAVGQGTTLFNKMLKGTPQLSSVVELMKGKRWWFFDNTGQAKQPGEAKEIIYGHCFSPDSHAVIVYCKTRDGKKYRRLATRDEMTGIQKPDWQMTRGGVTPSQGTCSEGEREDITVSKRVFNSGRAGVPVGHSDTPTRMDIQESLPAKTNCRGTDNGVTRSRVDKPDKKKSVEADSYVVTGLHAGEEAKHSKTGEGWRQYSPSQRLDLLNSKHGSPFRVARSSVGGRDAFSAKSRCPCPPKKAGDMLRECSLSHLCPVCKPGFPCFQNYKASPKTSGFGRLVESNEDVDAFVGEVREGACRNLAAKSNEEILRPEIIVNYTSITDTNYIDAMNRLADTQREGMPKGGHVRYKSPPKRRRSVSTSSCPEVTWREVRGSPNAKSCDLNVKDNGHSNVKRNLSSSFERTPESEQDISGSSEEDPRGLYHRKAKKGKRPTEGRMTNAYDLSGSPTRKHRAAKEVDDSSELMKLIASPTRNPTVNSSPKKNSKMNNSPTRKPTKGKPVHDLQDIRTISPPRRSRRCSGWKVNNLSPEKITPGKRRGFPHTAPCTKILNELWNMSESDPFASDRKKKHEQLPPDYYKIVKRPMWLEWIARKLADRAYVHLREFVHDVKRIFWNCHLYNKSGKILGDCRMLEEVFNNLMMEYFPEQYDDLIGLTGNPDECRPDSDHTSDEQEEIPIKPFANPVRNLIS